ncbi:MAG: tripartite tricarboxylate transporter substrate binding protein [Burkholderiales bacterium]|nr:tripartite tricarboxylate transporter substrate binding protein [Burkholderiales bacterium]
MSAVIARMLVAVTVGLLAPAVGAQSYPGKPVRIVVGFPAGGPTDVVTRVLAHKLAEGFGQSVVVENRTGGGGVPAAEFAAKSPPDGYTLMMGTLGTLVVNRHLHANLPYEPLRDFAPISQVVSNTNFLVVHPSVPARSLNEVLALARRQPGKLNYASSGNGTTPHLAGELFKMMAKVQITHVPYRGGAPALTALLAGEVDVSFENALVATPHVRSRRLRALAVTSGKRMSALPGLPTMSEAGLPGYEVTGWYGLVVASAAPKVVMERVHAESAKALRQKDVIDQLANQGSDAVGSAPAEFAAFIRSETEKWGKVIKAAKMRLD